MKKPSPQEDDEGVTFHRESETANCHKSPRARSSIAFHRRVSHRATWDERDAESIAGEAGGQVVRSADSSPHRNRRRRSLASICPVVLACMPSRKGKAGHNPHGNESLFEDSFLAPSYPFVRDFQELFSSDSVFFAVMRW